MLHISGIIHMLLMFKMIIPPCVFFIFSKFWFSRLLGGQQIAQNDKKFCLSCSIYQEPYVIWSLFLVCKCKMIISPGVFFFYFFKILIFWVVRRVKGQKWPKMTKNWPLLFISREPYIIWSWFMVYMYKRIISPGHSA